LRSGVARSTVDLVEDDEYGNGMVAVLPFKREQQRVHDLERAIEVLDEQRVVLQQRFSELRAEIDPLEVASEFRRIDRWREILWRAMSAGLLLVMVAVAVFGFVCGVAYATGADVDVTPVLRM